MKSLALIIALSIRTLSVAQSDFFTGCYSNCDGNGMSSTYFIQFNEDSTFNYSKRTGLSVDDATGHYSIKENIIEFDFEFVEPDSAYFKFTNSLNQLDSVLIQMPSINILMKRPNQLYLVKRKIFFDKPKNNREARRSKFNLVRKEVPCSN